LRRTSTPAILLWLARPSGEFNNSPASHGKVPGSGIVFADLRFFSAMASRATIFALLSVSSLHHRAGDRADVGARVDEGHAR
jgi:hypothetical protein